MVVGLLLLGGSWKITGVTDELWKVDGRRQAAKWKGRIRSPAILMENREMILQTDTLSWFVNLSELLRQADMNRNIPQKPKESTSTDCWEGAAPTQLIIQLKLNYCKLFTKESVFIYCWCCDSSPCVCKQHYEHHLSAQTPKFFVHV